MHPIERATSKIPVRNPIFSTFRKLEKEMLILLLMWWTLWWPKCEEKKNACIISWCFRFQNKNIVSPVRPIELTTLVVPHRTTFYKKESAWKCLTVTYMKCENMGYNTYSSTHFLNNMDMNTKGHSKAKRGRSRHPRRRQIRQLKYPGPHSGALELANWYAVSMIYLSCSSGI